MSQIISANILRILSPIVNIDKRNPVKQHLQLKGFKHADVVLRDNLVECFLYLHQQFLHFLLAIVLNAQINILVFVFFRYNGLCSFFLQFNLFDPLACLFADGKEQLEIFVNL